jgi:hypothetical protein
MFKPKTKSEVPIVPVVPPGTGNRFYDALGIGFNIGLALIAIALVWDFWFGRPETNSIENAWLYLFTTGIGLSGVCWIGSSPLRRWLKTAGVCGIVVATVYNAIEISRSYDTDQRVLRPGRIDSGRFVHDALGLSFRVPNLRPLLNVSVSSSRPMERSAGKPTRLRYGEEATLFKLAAPDDPDGRSSPIRLSATPFRFSRLDIVVLQVRDNMATFASQPGERIARAISFRRVGKLDVMDFELMYEPKHILTRYVFVRSGSYLLTFVLRSPNEQDRELFDQFTASIRVTGHASHFDD